MSIVAERPVSGNTTPRDTSLSPRNQEKAHALGITSSTGLVIGSIVGTGVFTMPAVLAGAGTMGIAVLGGSMRIPVTSSVISPGTWSVGATGYKLGPEMRPSSPPGSSTWTPSSAFLTHRGWRTGPSPWSDSGFPPSSTWWA